MHERAAATDTRMDAAAAAVLTPGRNFLLRKNNTTTATLESFRGGFTLPGIGSRAELHSRG